jgi:hypothetical protein
MGVVQLPARRLRGQVSDRAALRQGIAGSRARVKLVRSEAFRLVEYCDSCATPIEGGAVMRGTNVFCSVECSLQGPGRSA